MSTTYQKPTRSFNGVKNCTIRRPNIWQIILNHLMIVCFVKLSPTYENMVRNRCPWVKFLDTHPMNTLLCNDVKLYLWHSDIHNHNLLKWWKLWFQVRFLYNSQDFIFSRYRTEKNNVRNRRAFATRNLLFFTYGWRDNGGYIKMSSKR